jgi:RNA polymerase sigma-70 factor (ECF subfamily)
VFDGYRPRIHAFLLRLSKRRDTAEDLTQDTFVKLAKAAPGLPEDTRLGPLLFTIARNTYVSHRRWAMFDLSRVFSIGEETDFVSADPPPDVGAERAEELARLERALLRLRPADREVLLLVGVEGMDQAEAALVLGLSHDTLRQRLARARAALRDRMNRTAARAPAAATGDPS